jgi:hypothetical protein
MDDTRGFPSVTLTIALREKQKSVDPDNCDSASREKQKSRLGWDSVLLFVLSRTDVRATTRAGRH